MNFPTKYFSTCFFNAVPFACFVMGFAFCCIPTKSYSQQKSDYASIDSLKNMSLEQLTNIEVTSVSRRPEKLSEVASAIQVITQEEIRRSGATSLPEALRLSPNLQVAQYSSYAWIISARGFNNVFSNKLLVMIDGRTVYSPLFAGVYWDAQSMPLEDVDRIEVISGPGGTLWGANAVNGVINIITKKAKDIQGLYVSAARGSQLHDQVTARYGGAIGSNITYRIFVQREDRDPTLLYNGKNNTDKWNRNQGGFRLDWNASGKDKLSFEGNLEGGTEHTQPGPSVFDEQNITGQWSHTFSEKSDLKLQTYYVRDWRRDLPSTFNDQMQQYDIDFQHHYVLGKHNNLVWGGGYRFIKDESHSTSIVGFLPPNRNLDMYNAFVQDEIELVPNRFKFTLGTKLLNDVYTKCEVQPSGRLTWTPSQMQTWWAAVSRAVRTPSRIDVDYYIPTYSLPDNVAHVAGGPDFGSEKLVAYELGYRVQPNSKLSISLAGFYNNYTDLKTVEALPGTRVYTEQNGVEGHAQGLEFSGAYQLYDTWELRGGYTLFSKNLRNQPGHNFDVSYEGTDPGHQIELQSMINLFKHFQFDVSGRYVSELPLSVVAGVPKVNPYANFDARIAWQFRKFELSLVGQNLANAKHVEFATNQIQRNIYARLTVKL